MFISGVSFTAFRAYFAALPWTAHDQSKKRRTWESAALEERSSTVASQKSLSSAVSNNQVNKTASAAETQTAAKTMPALSELTEKDEQKLIEFIDSIISGQRMLIHSLWTPLHQKHGDKLGCERRSRARTVSLLSTASFLRRSGIRCHCGPNCIVKRLSRLIEDMKNGMKMTMDILGARIDSHSAEFKRGVGNAWIQMCLDDHQTLLEVIGPYCPSKPLGQTVRLRRAPLTAEKARQASQTPISLSVSTSSVAVSDPTPSPIHGCGCYQRV